MKWIYMIFIVTGFGYSHLRWETCGAGCEKPVQDWTLD